MIALRVRKGKKMRENRLPLKLDKGIKLRRMEVRMHIKNTYRYKNIVEVERLNSGRYGKRTSPSERRAPTPEEMAAANERQCIRKLRRKIHANFDEQDLFETLTYAKDKRPDPKGAAHELKLLLDRLRRIWKRAGTDLRYIVVTEYKNKSIHHHLIINDLPDGTGSRKVAESWKRNGHSNTKYLYQDGQYEQLASYLIKETAKTFRDPSNPSRLRYSCSRNLVTPKARTEIMKKDDWPEDPRIPKGYYLDKGSLVNGVNKMGYRYQYYRMVKIGWKKPSHKGKKRKEPTQRKNKKQRRVAKKGRKMESSTSL